MRRFLATLVLDGFVQARNSLYAVGLGMAVAWGLAARFGLDAQALSPWLPPLLLMHLGSTTYFFMAALVIFERDQDTLTAQSVTPLRFSEYLGSKLLTLSLFGALESVVLLAIAGALDGIRWVLLFVAITVLGGVYGLLGFIQALPSRSITDFLIPNAMVMGVLLTLPVFPYFGIAESPLWLLVPTCGPMELIAAATVGASTTTWVSALIASMVWIGLGGFWAQKTYSSLWLGGGDHPALEVTG